MKKMDSKRNLISLFSLLVLLFVGFSSQAQGVINNPDDAVIVINDEINTLANEIALLAPGSAQYKEKLTTATYYRLVVDDIVTNDSAVQPAMETQTDNALEDSVPNAGLIRKNLYQGLYDLLAN